MNQDNSCLNRRRWISPPVLSAIAFCALSALSSTTVAQSFEGYTEPFRVVNVATSETGIVATVRVQEGDYVQKGEELATLDSDLHQVMLAIAAEQMKAVGRLQAAQSELSVKEQRLEKLIQLRDEGNARQEEVERTQADVEIATSQVEAIHEELKVRKLEHERARLQLARRTIRAPLDGVITKSLKAEGEFVAPNDPVLFTIASLDPILANHSLPSKQISAFRVGQNVEVTIETSGRRVQGVVEMISPVTDAGSGTVPIKIRIANPEGRIRSGERCILELPAQPHAES